jgi:hypothetical protein
MKKLFGILSLILLSQNTFAQAIFKVNPNVNHLDSIDCINNHQKILDLYSKQLSSQVDRIINGLVIEKQKNTDPAILKIYKQYASELIIKSIVIDELTEQLSGAKKLIADSKDNKALFRSGKIFNTDNIEVRLRAQFNKVLAEANKKEGFGHYVLDEFKHELVKDALIHFGESAFKSIGNGLVLKIFAGSVAKSVTSSMIEHALISFGAGVIKGAVVGTIVSILTEPLYGARLPPETMWLDVLEEHPELVINPEWMNKAGVPDAPWNTHCLTINRKAKRLEAVVEYFIQKEENEFLQSITSIHQKNLDLIERKSKQDILNQYSIQPAVQDNTRVQIFVPYYAKAPYWVFLK